MRNGFLVGVAAGAVLMYYFDPSWGRRRRAQLLDGIDRGRRQVEAMRLHAGRTPDADERAFRGGDPEIDWSHGDAYRGRLLEERGAG